MPERHFAVSHVLAVLQSDIVQLFTPGERVEVSLVPLARGRTKLVRQVEGTNAPALGVSHDSARGLRIIAECRVLVNLLLQIIDRDDLAPIVVQIALLLHLLVICQLAFVGVEVHVLSRECPLLFDQFRVVGLPFRTVKGSLQKP